jgi:hypothetical protein
MPAPTARDLLGSMISGYWISQAIYVAAKLGIPDRLAGGPKPVSDLARQTGSHARSLYRVLRALSNVGIFREGDNEHFALTPIAELLRSDAPMSQRPLALMMGEEHYQAFGHLFYTVQTGVTAFEAIHGKPLFQFLEEHPEQAALFDAAMTAVHGRETEAMLEAYDFTGIGVLADIGGGNGTTLCGVLERYPAMTGILYDLAHVIERARPAIVAAGLAARYQTVAGSFFETVPSGADAYLLRHIIHDWDGEKSTVILGNVHRSMRDGARLLVVESVIPPPNQPSFGKLLDLTMMVSPGGLERTAEEFRALLAQSGFRLARVVPTSAEVCVIEGLKS